MAEYPRYNRIQQRSVHNAYLKAEQLIDQLIFHRVRDLELDLHRWAQLGCPYTAPPDWGIYHTIGEAGTNVCKVGEALRLFSAFHRGNPSHEVVTVHLELKSRGTGEAVGVFDDYPADDLDRVLVRWLGRAHIFAPADLLAANPGSPALHDAANTGSGGGWPSVDKLRGRFIFVVHGAPELDSYATAATATGRLCFLMREVLADDDRLITANRHVVFLGEVGNPALVRIRSRFPGLILRARQADDADGFFRAQSAGANLILTDAVDVHDKPWARTHNARLYPFAAVGERGAGATQHASVRDLVEREPLHVIVTHSSDIWGTRDSCTFAQSRSFPPRSRLDRPAEGRLVRAARSASNDTVDGWGKVVLMARDAAAPGARYFSRHRQSRRRPRTVRPVARTRRREHRETQLATIPTGSTGLDSACRSRERHLGPAAAGHRPDVHHQAVHRWRHRRRRHVAAHRGPGHERSFEFRGSPPAARAPDP